MDNDCTVLVIEDVARPARRCASSSRRRDTTCAPLRNGVEALAAAANSRPDAVLLDSSSRSRMASRCCGASRGAIPAVPVIVMSALSQAEDVVRAMKLGATDYLPKPFDVSKRTSCCAAPSRPRTASA